MIDRISRREILSLVAALPFAAATTAAATAADDSGGTKAKYKYISKPGPKHEVCISCSLFKAPAACVIVKGHVSPNGYCVAWVPKAK